jgi:hypothetical protein
VARRGNGRVAGGAAEAAPSRGTGAVDAARGSEPGAARDARRPAGDTAGADSFRRCAIGVAVRAFAAVDDRLACGRPRTGADSLVAGADSDCLDLDQGGRRAFFGTLGGPCGGSPDAGGANAIAG